MGVICDGSFALCRPMTIVPGLSVWRAESVRDVLKVNCMLLR